jgi:hypothetical protein
MWPNKRVQAGELRRLTDPNASDAGDKRVVVRKKDTRAMVRATVPAQRRGGSK